MHAVLEWEGKGKERTALRVLYVCMCLMHISSCMWRLCGMLLYIAARVCL